MTEQEIAKAQFEWDTLLVAGWRRFWTWQQTCNEFVKLGYTWEDFQSLKRTIVPIRENRSPVRAVLANWLFDFSERLWRCKDNAHFIAVRNQLNASSPEFVRYHYPRDRERDAAKRALKHDRALNDFVRSNYLASRDRAELSTSTDRASKRKNRGLA